MRCRIYNNGHWYLKSVYIKDAFYSIPQEVAVPASSFLASIN